MSPLVLAACIILHYIRGGKMVCTLPKLSKRNLIYEARKLGQRFCSTLPAYLGTKPANGRKGRIKF